MNSKGVLMTPTPQTTECCMCGDYGLLDELFQCNICLFRHQHRYCSNLYPKGGSYITCNWCLKKQEEPSTPPTPTTTTTTHSSSISSNNEDKDNKNKNKKMKSNCNEGSSHVKGNFMLNINNNNPIKKQKSQDHESSSSMQKKSLSSVTKQVFRGKVRRYKLLEEVCR